MNEVDYSRLLDSILAEQLAKPNVEAILTAAAGALLSDTFNVKSACEGETQYKVASEKWSLLTHKILDSYDSLLTYFDKQDSKTLEQAFDLVSTSLAEQGKLLAHLPPRLSPKGSNQSLSFWDEDPEVAYTNLLERLDSLTRRQSRDALGRQVETSIEAFKYDDEAFLGEIDSDKVRRRYQRNSKKLLTQLRKLVKAEEPEERSVLLEVVEELIAERLSIQQEL